MKAMCLGGIGILVGLVTFVTTATAQDVSDAQVRQAIDRGVAFLLSQQDKARGGWPEHPSQPCGLSALCTLALLNSGQDPRQPEMQRALDYLRAFDKPELVYSVALQTMALCAAEPVKDRLLIRRNANWLEAVQLKSGVRKGSWGYSDRQGKGDNSNTQFALLALHEAERVGVSVQESTWRLALAYWLDSQNPDGSWGYFREQPPTGSMTCAGLGSVVIAGGRLNSGAARVQGDQVVCCGPVAGDDAAERAFQWLSKRFSMTSNPGDRMWLLYYLYGVERTGRLTGRRFIGGEDWYRKGAEILVAAQHELSGHWKGVGHAEENPLIATSLALLFLSKGRRPVVLAKLKHPGADWDQHPAGVPHLTRHVERRWLRELTWQTVDFSTASLADLLEAPILFLSGRDALQFTAEQKAQLREYISQGGFIFAEACQGNGCDGRAFDASFRALAQELFPDSRLRALPPDHPVWYAEEKVLPSANRPLLGIDACCRTSVVYCPANLSCFWELGQPLREAPYPEVVQAEIDECVKIGLNVVAYATNRILKEKLDPPTITRHDTSLTATARGVLVIPKLAHSGGSDDAPNALVHLLEFCRGQLELRASSEPRLVAPGDPKLHEYPLLFTQGRRDFQWTPAERAALATYLRRGGVLFADAICASPQFATALRRELAAILPEHPLARIPNEHPLLTPEFGGFDIRSVTLNDPTTRGEGDPLAARRVKTEPLLEGIQIDGRWVVIFSPYDISCALESRGSLECRGYVREDAARIGTNVLLYALQQ